MWGFLLEVEDNQVVATSTTGSETVPAQGAVQPQQAVAVPAEPAYTKAEFLIRIQAAAARNKEHNPGQGGMHIGQYRQAVQQDFPDATINMFQRTEKLFPLLEGQLTGADGGRKLALCGMLGLEKTTIARRIFDNLRVQPGFDAALFMSVFKAPAALRQLLTRLAWTS